MLHKVVEVPCVNGDGDPEDWTMGCDRKCEEPKNHMQVDSEQPASVGQYHLPKWAGQEEGH